MARHGVRGEAWSGAGDTVGRHYRTAGHKKVAEFLPLPSTWEVGLPDWTWVCGFHVDALFGITRTCFCPKCEVQMMHIDWSLVSN